MLIAFASQATRRGAPMDCDTLAKPRARARCGARMVRLTQRRSISPAADLRALPNAAAADTLGAEATLNAIDPRTVGGTGSEVVPRTRDRARATGARGIRRRPKTTSGRTVPPLRGNHPRQEHRCNLLRRIDRPAQLVDRGTNQQRDTGADQMAGGSAPGQRQRDDGGGDRDGKSPR